jgi:hypothetical protein
MGVLEIDQSRQEPIFRRIIPEICISNFEISSATLLHFPRHVAQISIMRDSIILGKILFANKAGLSL